MYLSYVTVWSKVAQMQIGRKFASLTFTILSTWYTVVLRYHYSDIVENIKLNTLTYFSTLYHFLKGTNYVVVSFFLHSKELAIFSQHHPLCLFQCSNRWPCLQSFVRKLLNRWCRQMYKYPKMLWTYNESTGHDWAKAIFKIMKPNLNVWILE